MKAANQYSILFVDDEPWLSEPLRMSLEGMGYNCISTKNATEALRVLESEYIDVMITDIMMDGGDLFEDVDSQEMGFELIERIRKRWPDQPIICLSVIGDVDRILSLKRKNILYLRKGETPLDTAIKLIESKATGRIQF